MLYVYTHTHSGTSVIQTDLQYLPPLQKSRMTKGSEFESQWGQEFSLLYIVQTGSGAQPASNPMGIGGRFPGSKAAGA
jgi:hypothetical protein